MQTLAPKLSIITVTFNAGKYISKTLSSISMQDYDDFELIIIDGDSSDDTLKVVSKYTGLSPRIVSEADTGIYDAMNKGIEIARGEYVQFLNAGDYYCDKNVLSKMFKPDTDDIDILYGDINIEYENGSISYQVAGEFTLDNLLKRGTGVVCHQAIFVKRLIAPKYNCSYRFKAELNWYFDLAEKKVSYAHVETPVVNYTLGGFGHQHFLKNRFEWLWLAIRRYGFISVYQSGLVGFLLKNATYRYKFMAMIYSLPTTVFSYFKR